MTTAGSPRTPSLPELLAAHADAVRRSVNVALPGRVEKYDADEQRADVKPLIKNLVADRDGEEILEELPVIPGVPVLFPRAGGFFMSMPVAAGDLVLLIVCDRSVDNYKSGRGTVTDPDDFRAHDWTDAVALPGFYPFGKSISDSGVSANLVVGKESGAQIHVKPDQISLYEENAAQFVALAQKVLDELTTARNDRIANKGVFDAHGHITTATVGAGPPGVIAPPVAGFPAQTAPSSVAASKVKAT